MRARSLALVYAWSSLSCVADPRAGAEGSRAQHDAIVAARAATNDADAGPARADGHTSYALAEHLERAEQRRHEAHLFDFGVPGDAKYTFGGWLSKRTDTRRFGARSALQIRGGSLLLSLPVTRTDLTSLTLELMSGAPATLTVLLHGRVVDSARLRGHSFEAVNMQLTGQSLQLGSNLLELRLSGPDPTLTLDSIALSRARTTLSELTPQPLEVLHPEPDSLRLPAGLTLSYAFEVPQAASFRARVSGPLSVHITRDGQPSAELARIADTRSAHSVYCDLSAFAGQVVSLELTADNAPVRLDEPRIRTLTEPRAREPSFRPMRNVVLYVVDTLRTDRLSAYARDTRVHTPGLARFLEQAAVLTAARSQENWTKPSIATLLTSSYPWQHDTVRHESVLPSELEPLPQRLSALGMHTAAFVANGYVSEKFGFQRGFAHFRNYIRQAQRSDAEAVTHDALTWLDQRPADKPFFLYVHTIDPHVPYEAPNDFLTLYDPEPYAGPVSFDPAHGSEHLLERIKLGQLTLTPRDKQHLVALYDAEVSYHDAHFAAFMTGLAQRGLADDTLVVVTADHGEEFWDHGSVGHGHSVFDELLHVPLFVRLPGVTQAGDRITTNVGLVDVAPTILDALGERAPETMHGHSFLPELLGDTADAPRTSVSGFMTVFRTLSAGRYKLVQQRREHAFVYDTSSDPAETHDLSGERPLALSYLRALLGLQLAERPSGRLVYTAERTAIDVPTERQLRALGYVGSARH